jgi:hypothetical protein
MIILNDIKITKELLEKCNKNITDEGKELVKDLNKIEIINKLIENKKKCDYEIPFTLEIIFAYELNLELQELFIILQSLVSYCDTYITQKIIK